MILSQEQSFTVPGGQTLTTGAVVSGNTIDLGVQGTVPKGPAALIRDVGPGQPVPVGVTINGGTAAATVTCDIITSAAANLGTPTVLVSDPIVLDASGRGTSHLNFLPDQIRQRYLGMRFITTAGAGTVVAAVVLSKQTNRVAGA